MFSPLFSGKTYNNGAYDVPGELVYFLLTESLMPSKVLFWAETTGDKQHVICDRRNTLPPSPVRSTFMRASVK